MQQQLQGLAPFETTGHTQPPGFSSLTRSYREHYWLVYAAQAVTAYFASLHLKHELDMAEHVPAHRHSSAAQAALS